MSYICIVPWKKNEKFCFTIILMKTVSNVPIQHWSGASMVEWLESLHRITCPSPLWVQIPPGILDSFMWGSYPASLWNVSSSTQTCKMQGTPDIFLYNKSHHITFTVLVWHKPQPKEKERNSTDHFQTLWKKVKTCTCKNILVDRSTLNHMSQ